MYIEIRRFNLNRVQRNINTKVKLFTAIRRFSRIFRLLYLFIHRIHRVTTVYFI